MSLGWTKSAVVAVLAVAIASPVLAQAVAPPVRIIAAPAPEAGAGLPFLLLAGGYVLVRRHRRRKAEQPELGVQKMSWAITGITMEGNTDAQSPV